jgi:hypothetical protein
VDDSSVKASGPRGLARAVAKSSSAVLVLTLLHHAYGGVIYGAPFRRHAVVAFGVFLALLVTLLAIFARRPATSLGRAAGWLAAGSAALVPVLAVGLFEGLYNHLLKNGLYFGGASGELMRALFPPPRYKFPNDFAFELSGVLQFVIALPAARDIVPLVAWLWSTKPPSAPSPGAAALAGSVS